MRTLLALLVLLGAAVSGCFGGDDTDDHDDHVPDGDDDPGPGDNETSEPHAPPVANITADVDFGEAPLTVNFVLSVEAHEGAELEWTFDANGDGQADAEGNEFQLPFEFEFIFEESGLFTATFTVTSGNDTVTANRLITIEAAEVPEFEDRGWYIFEFATGHCYVKEYETHGTGPVLFYVSGMGGSGTWVIAETNGVAGLQAESNFPGQPPGFTLDIPDCVDGDQIVF